jgi:hypothetical protein
MGKKRNANMVFMGNPNGNTPPAKCGHSWENIKIDLNESNSRLIWLGIGTSARLL